MPKNEKLFQTAIYYTLGLPYSKAIGLAFEHTNQNRPVFSVNWREVLVGDVNSQVIHGGVLTTLIDVTGGVAVSAHLEDYESLVTLDLRIDYLTAAKVGKKIYAQSECYRLTGQVAFVRTTCFHEDVNKPIAFGMATYMRTPLPAEIKEKLQ